MVNTFCISPDPYVTAAYLDDRRLGKQRVEAMQIINALEGKTEGWRNHPAARSWIGYVDGLKHYCNVMMYEWAKRGKKNEKMTFYQLPEVVMYPLWFAHTKVHYSHMARLVQKDPDFYSSRFSYPEEYNQYGYIWPYKYSIEQLDQLHVSQLAEDLPKDHPCVAITTSGKRCNNKATVYDYCKVHCPPELAHQYATLKCDSVKKDGTQCANRPTHGTKCGVHKPKA